MKPISSVQLTGSTPRAFGRMEGTDHLNELRLDEPAAAELLDIDGTAEIDSCDQRERGVRQDVFTPGIDECRNDRFYTRNREPSDGPQDRSSTAEMVLPKERERKGSHRVQPRPTSTGSSARGARMIETFRLRPRISSHNSSIVAASATT